MVPVIRPLKPGDQESVFRMMRIFYDSAAVLVKSPDAVLKKDIEDALSPLPFLDGYVFEANGKIAGYAMVARSYSTEYGGECLWIEDLYIQESFRHRGLSRAFFAFLEQRYPEAVRFKLEVEAENEAAIEAYRKSGFSRMTYFEMSKER